MTDVNAAMAGGDEPRAGVDPQSRSAPASVRIERSDGRYRLMVDDAPYAVHGAGMGFGDAAGVATLAAAGGNTFRTWESDNIDGQLAAARANGLMVLVGLDVQKQLQGFDYGDMAAVEAQFEAVTAFIDRYKDDPAVLGWILANEPNLMIDVIRPGGAGQPGRLRGAWRYPRLHPRDRSTSSGNCRIRIHANAGG